MLFAGKKPTKPKGTGFSMFLRFQTKNKDMGCCNEIKPIVGRLLLFSNYKSQNIDHLKNPFDSCYF